MAISIAEKIHDTTSHIKQQITDTLYQYSVVIHSLVTKRVPIANNINFDPIHRFVDKIDTLNDQLRLYRLFDPTLDFYTDEVNVKIGEIADYLKQWMRKSVVSTKDACVKFSRSKSTIYRWIKAGRLIAEKIGGRWLIVV